MKPFNISIYLGLKEHYDGTEHETPEVISFLQYYVSSNPICFSVTPTSFVHPSGAEKGVIIGLIQYPRFPKEEKELISIALDVAESLRIKFRQYRVTVGFPDNMIMLGEK